FRRRALLERPRLRSEGMSRASDPSCTCRPARAEDAPAIRELLLECHLSAPVVGDVERATRARIGEILTLVCERKRQLAGVLQWWYLVKEAEILDLAFRPIHRRHGHASSLLKHFLEALTNANTVFLEVRESNAAAIALYQKFGFQVSGQRRNYYRHPQESAIL